jgi:CMP-N-acetylneuraminic acid synthetase
VNVLGLITARGGSKGIPGKNLAPCGGKPLLAWTCEAARAAPCLTRTVISTDDRAIAELAVGFGIAAPFMRPDALATDTATSLDVVRHTVDWLATNEQWATDVVVLLQPTSPLRTTRHITEAFARLDADIDSVVSVIEVPHRFKPWSLMALDGDRLTDYRDGQTGELPFDRYRRQDQPTLYARNGPAVLVTTVARMTPGSLYGPRIAPYHMAPADSVDIDTLDDLALADWLLRQRLSANAELEPG